jgi:hypothetical protein
MIKSSSASKPSAPKEFSDCDPTIGLEQPADLGFLDYCFPKISFVAVANVPTKLEIFKDCPTAVIQAFIYCFGGMPLWKAPNGLDHGATF